MFYMEVRLASSLSRASLTIKQEEEKKPSKSARSKDAKSPRKAAPTTVVKSKLRGEGREVDSEAANRRKQHQKELALRRQEEGLSRYSEDGGAGKGAREKQWRRFEAYARESQIPESVASQKVSLCVLSRRGADEVAVDCGRQPTRSDHPSYQWLCGSVPYQHTQERREAGGGRLYRSATHVYDAWRDHGQEGGHGTSLRPVAWTEAHSSNATQPFEDPNATFIRGITYRSTDSFRFAEIHKEISDLKKAATKKENEKKEMADVVEQDRLIELKGASALRSGSAGLG